MFSQFSVGGRPKSSQRPRVGLTMKVMKDQPQLCFSCEQLFPSRLSLEEHACPAAAFICSCGTEFPLYADMLEHSNTHEPGHRVLLDHKTITHRRSVQQQHDEEQLRRLAAPSQQSMQSMWTLPPGGSLAAPSQQSMQTMWSLPTRYHSGQTAGMSAAGAAAFEAARKRPFGSLTSQLHVASSTGAKINARLPSDAQLKAMSSSSSPLQSPLLSGAGAAGSPTADLWTLYQPVVVVKRLEKRFNRELRFICGKCDMRFKTRRELTSHHNNTHITDKVFGCIGCGVLLSSKKSVPRYHQCNSYSSSLKMRLITARPFSERKQSGRMNSAKANASNSRNNNSRIDLTRAHNSASSYRKSAQKQQPQQQRRPPAAFAAATAPPRPLQSSARMQTEFMLANQANKAAEMSAFGGKKNGFTCQICHIDFEALQMLQRHKCAKAREFVEQQLQLGKLPSRFRKLTQPVAAPVVPLALVKSPSPSAYLNGGGNSKYAGLPPANSNNNNMTPFAAMKTAAGLVAASRAQAESSPQPAAGEEGKEASTTDATDDDECFIVENNPPAPVEPEPVEPVLPVQMFQALNASLHIVQM